jgi:hypothetical protein
MIITFEKEYLRDLYETGETDDRSVGISPKSCANTRIA